jgi:cytochrome b561
MTDRYSRTAIALHWLIALMIFTSIPLGLYMVGLPLSPRKLQLYSYHKWLGITILTLVLVRIAWRLAHRPPPMPAMSRWQTLAAHATHALLYLLMVAVPLSGWLMSSALGFQVVWFGVLPLPDLVGKDKQLGELLKTVHLALNAGLGALLVVHLGAALQHQFLLRDGLLLRMLPRPSRRGA